MPDYSDSTGNRESVFNAIRTQIVGRLSSIHGPFGTVPLVYADWTASGRALACIESYIAKEILPVYGNTHTNASLAGSQSTCFQVEARQILAEHVNAKITGRASQDSVIFCGQGATSAIAKFVEMLGLKQSILPNSPKIEIPVVFVGPHEHHSNLLPWRESYAEVVMIRDKALACKEDYCSDAGIDMDHLERMLIKYRDRLTKIGAFSAASNLTGVLIDTNAVSALLHRYGALACWDCATAGPHVKIDMNPMVIGENQPFVYKDAIFMSGHKFIGGPSTPGILVVKRNILNGNVPTIPGGGSVFFVTPNSHRFLSNIEEREEAGSPDLVGIARLGLVMKIQQQLSTVHKLVDEEKLTAFVTESLLMNENIIVLGQDYRNIRTQHTAKLPIFSFLIKYKLQLNPNRTMYLHFNFVCALLNDLFGVQSRGGCMCAGPYAQRLLGMYTKSVRDIEKQLLLKHELLRPGFTRISFAAFDSQAEIQHILHAINFISNNGHLFLHQYRMNHVNGEWKHIGRVNRFPERRWLGNFSLHANAVQALEVETESNMSEIDKLHQVQLNAEMEAMKAKQELENPKSSSLGSNITHVFPEDAEKLRWFAYPWENSVKSDINFFDVESPIDPQRYFYISDEISSQFEWENELYDDTLQLEVDEVISDTSYNNYSDNAEVDVANTNKSTNLMYACVKEGQSEIPQRLEKYCSKYPIRIGRIENDVNSNQTCRLAQRRNECRSEPIEKSLNDILFPKPPVKLCRTVSQAITEWNMIEDGDRLCLGLSGGKDSMALLHVLMDLQKRAPVRFELSCATVDPQTSSFDPSPLIPYLKALNVKLHYLSDGIVERAKIKLQGDSLCSFCSRAKRGLLYTCCRENGYNKLVLAQHLDDLAESFMMSLLHNGQLRTMKANYLNDAGDIAIIRPLVYTREVATRDFSVNARLPIINENCPACFEHPKERARVKEMLKREESLYPAMFHCIRQSLVPLMHPTSYDVMNQIREKATERGSLSTRKKNRSTSARWDNQNSNKNEEVKQLEYTL